MEAHDEPGGDRLLAQLLDPRRRWPGVLLIVLLAAVAYWPALGNGYVWDDDDYVTANPLIPADDGLGRMWTPGETVQYYPVVFTTFWVEYRLWGLDPLGYHAVNVLLHALDALLVWAVFRRLGAPGAWLVGALFAVHPVHVESVAWITERKNLLSAAFYLSAALAYLRFDPMRDDRQRGSSLWYAAALALFVLALLSKTVTCSLPAALVLAMLFRRRRLSLRRLAPLLPMFAVGLVLALHTAHLERELVGAEGADFGLGFPARVLVASRALLFYPWKLLAPHGLAFVYPRWDVAVDDPEAYVPLLAVLVAIALAWYAFRAGRRGVPLALAFYAGTVFPALGFFNVYPHRFSFVADHFVYLASLGPLALVAAGLAILLRRTSWSALAAASVLAVLTVATRERTRAYHDEETLWLDTVEENPEAWLAYQNLAALSVREAYGARDRGDRAGMWNRAHAAERYARAALDVAPDLHRVRGSLAEALDLLDRQEEALRELSIGVEGEPGFPPMLWKLGVLYAKLGQEEAALELHQRALDAYRTALGRASRFERQGRSLRDYEVDLRLDLARLLERAGRTEEAATHAAGVLEIEPENLRARWMLVRDRVRQGELAQARDGYERILAGGGPAKDVLSVASEYVRFLLDCQDAGIRDLERARELAGWVAAQASEDPSALRLLGSVYAASERKEDALRVMRSALEAAREQGNSDLARELQVDIERLEGEG